MKITEVEPILLTVDMPEKHPLRWSGGETASVNCALVRVHTDEGITGLGDCYGSGFVAGEATAELFRLFGQFLQGKDPRDVAGCYEMMYRRILYWGTVRAGSSSGQCVGERPVGYCGESGQRAGISPAGRVVSREAADLCQRGPGAASGGSESRDEVTP